MLKNILVFLAAVSFFFGSYQNTYAVQNPSDSPNNKFGIHITNESDLQNASNLVNSAGGDWGYVTFVITEAERDHDRWQKIFDQMRRIHLIPIVRIATKASGEVWEKPSPAEINNWVAFLNSLNWVTENRYVIIGNEPNHANEWGGSVDPIAYGKYFSDFSSKLKNASGDFFVIPAGMDATAKNTQNTMDEALFLTQMVKNNPHMFDNADGWSSHSYPGANLNGSPSNTGRGSVSTYDWELPYLQTLGVTKKLPVFITETGWSNTAVSESQISQNYESAFLGVWSDPRVIAVTPFILNYPQSPFSQFSWQKSDGSFYSYYSDVQKIKKTKGQPVQRESGQIFAAIAQPIALSGSDFVGAIFARNTGESIWNQTSNGVSIDNSDGKILSYSFNEIEPMRLGLVIFKATSPNKPGIYRNSLFLTGTKGQRITNSFPIETFLVDMQKLQISRFFATIGGNLRSVLSIPKF